MKVKESIERLSEFNPEAEVIVDNFLSLSNDISWLADDQGFNMTISESKAVTTKMYLETECIEKDQEN